MARKSYGNHNLEKKSPGRKRTFRQFNPIEGKIKKNIRRKLGV